MAVENGHPPPAALKVLNPVFRTMLRRPRLARFAPSALILLCFAGRRTGRPYQLVVGWHEVDGERLVFTPSRWAANFTGGAPVVVIRGARRLRGTGTLVTDAEEIAPRLQQAVDQAGNPRAIGLRMAPGDRITAHDVRALPRRMVRLDVA